MIAVDFAKDTMAGRHLPLLHHPRQANRMRLFQNRRGSQRFKKARGFAFGTKRRGSFSPPRYGTALKIEGSRHMRSPGTTPLGPVGLLAFTAATR